MQSILCQTLRTLAERFKRSANNFEECDHTSEYDFQEYRLHLVHKKTKRQEKKKRMPQNLTERRRALKSFEVDREVHCRATWALSDSELSIVIRHFKGNPVAGIGALTEPLLHEIWRPYMQIELMTWWSEWLFHDQDEAVTYRRLCELVKSHSEGTLSSKAVVISQIILRTSMHHMVQHPGSCQSHDVSKYFRTVLLSYFEGLLYKGDQNLKMWRQAYENKLDLLKLRHYTEGIVQFYLSTSLIPDTMARVLHCLEISQMLDDITSAIVALGFGYGKLLNCSPIFMGGQSTILSIAQVTFLSYLLKADLSHRLVWEMLYNCQCDGKSYQLFNRRVGGESSTFIIFRDEHQNVFGAYLDKPWLRRKGFFGEKGCFLFRLHPVVVILPTSARSDNYCYFNFGDCYNPNGIGFGGDKEFFGLHIELESSRGVCADACLSYSNFERLSKYNFFHCEHIEVWKVYPEWREETANVSRKQYSPIPISHLYY